MYPVDIFHGDLLFSALHLSGWGGGGGGGRRRGSSEEYLAARGVASNLFSGQEIEAAVNVLHSHAAAKWRIHPSTPRPWLHLLAPPT